MATLALNQEVSDEAPLSLGTTPVDERPERNPVDTAAKAERVAYSIRDPHKDFLSPGSAHAQMAVQSEKMMAVTIAKAEAAYKDKQKLDILNQLASAKAEAGGGPLTPFETDSVLRLTTPELADPRTALERAFASAVVNDTLESKRDDWTGAVSEDPEKADGIASATESLIARQEVGRSLVERATKRSEDQSWLGAAADVAKTIIPTYTAIKYRNQIDLPDNPYFEGETLQRQSQYLWSITDPNEFKRVLEDGYEAMAKDNVVLAKQWLEAVLYGQTGTERTLNNVFTALDATDVANIGIGVGLGVARGVARGTLKDSLKSSTSRIAGVARDVAEVMGRHKVDVADTLTAAGNVVDAATLKALKNMDLIKKIETSPTADAADLAKLVTQTGPSLSDPTRMFDVGVPTRLTNQMAVRLAEQAERAMDAMSRVLTGINPISRLDEGAKLKTAFTKAQADLLELYPSVRTAVIDSQSRWVYGANTASNVNKVEIAIGRTNGDLFKSEKALRNTFDKYYKLADYRIERIGDKYYGVLTRDVDETARSVMDAPVNADANTPIKPFGYIFDKIRSADALLSKAQKGLRQTLVSSQDEMMRQYRIMSEPVQAMSRRERERVSKVLEHNRDFIDPTTNTRGMYYKTVNEFDEGFYNLNGRVPTRKEREGYFAAIRLNDFDYVLRNVNLYRNRAAMGIENWVYKIGDKYTTDLMGKYVDEIPWFDGHSAKILVIEKDGSTKIVNKANLSDFERAAIQESIEKNGRVVTQVFDQVSRPFDEYLPDHLKGEVVTFVVSPRPDRKPLSMQQIPYREGGHVVNDTKFFVKNVNLVQDGADVAYAGDLTFSGHVVEREAQQFAKLLEEGRRLFAEERRIGKQADRSLLDDFVETNLPFDPDEFRQMFHKGVLNDRGPIVVLKDGQHYNQIADVKETLGAKDLVNSPYSLYDQADRAFTAERGDALYRFKKGEPGNPKWKLETARTLNPIDTLNGALKSAIKSRLYTDYVKRSANEFIQEFGDLLAPSAATLRQNPQYWFYHPQWLNEAKISTTNVTKTRTREVIDNVAPGPSTQKLKDTWSGWATTPTFVPGDKLGPATNWPTPVFNGTYRNVYDLKGSYNPAKPYVDPPDWFADVEKLAAEIADRLDIPRVKLWYGDSSVTDGLFTAKALDDAANPTKVVPSVVLSKGLTREKALWTLAHEMGHAADFMALRNAPPSVFKEIFFDFKLWVKNKGSVKIGTQRPVVSAADETFDELSAQSPNSANWVRYATEFEEWFADETARWITTTAKPKTAVEKFFSDLADMWVKLYEKFFGGPGKVVTNQKVADFLQGRWREDKQVPRLITETFNEVQTEVSDFSNARLAAAKGMRDAIMHLIDTPTTFRQYFDTAKNRMINTVYDKLGADAAQWVDEKALFRTRDPIRFLRGAAFHSSMGFFNPVQFFLQASTLMHATAISPKHALPAMKDAMNIWISMKNGTPEILAHMKAKSGYKYFDELREELTRSGWMNVGGSTAWLDDALEPNVVSGPASTFLDAGTVFFKRGEQMVRAVAYTTAHREWRAANPNAKITDQVRRDLIKRADNLSVNMTRASNAWINNGVMSVPTQFTSFAFRMSEQLLEGAFSGKGALTRAETARVMGMYSMMYGVPTAAAAALGIIPVNKMFEEYAMENGYDLEGDVLSKAFSRGIANVIGDLVIGENTNINERYGPSGSPLIAEILAGEKNVVEAFLGATGSIMTKTWQGSYPLLTSIGNIFTPEEADFPLVPSDFLDAARTISTVENATKAYMAYNWNLWITKNEMQMADAGGFSALTAVLLGLTPREVTDIYVAKDILKNAGDHRREVGMMVEKEIQRMMRAELDGDAKLAARHLKRAQSWVAASDMSESEKASVFVNAMRGFGTEADEVNLKMLKRSQNKEILDRRIDTMERKAQEKRTAQ